MTGCPIDFVIVGAPKCGTTSLAAWLGEHPAVFMSPIKEPNYFLIDVPSKRCSEEKYKALFAQAQPWQLCGEASTSYLFSPAAVPAILESNPDAKIIAMVRNPLDMVVSYHAQKIYSLQEVEPYFPLAWSLSAARGTGTMASMQNHDPRYLDYRAVGKFGAQIARLKERVPPGQLHVIVFDDLRADKEAVYRDALLFLGLEPEDHDDLPALNARKARRCSTLAEFVRHPPAILRPLKRAMLAVCPTQSRALGQRVKDLNTRPVERQRVNGELHREMVDAFRDDVALLGRLLGRELNHWLA